jgi:hypothetical protein
MMNDVDASADQSQSEHDLPSLSARSSGPCRCARVVFKTCGWECSRVIRSSQSPVARMFTLSGL